MTVEERKNRIIARGEFSDHCHVVKGDAEVTRDDGKINIKVGPDGATICHLIESAWMNGQEVWTEEHVDIPVEEGKYEHVDQIEFDPYEEAIKRMRD